MNGSIAFVLVVLAAATVCLIRGRPRVDLVALLVLASLALTHMITPEQATAGFANPAVITIWAVFILGGGIARTGLATALGNRLLRVGGRGEARLIAVIVVVAGVLSAFVNNVGVAALMLPVVMDIARRTGVAPSRLLIPLAFGTLFGGATTQIGTSSNILVGSALKEHGEGAFQLFHFSLVGVPVFALCLAYLLSVGRRLLPHRDMAQESWSGRKGVDELYGLRQELCSLEVPAHSALDGKTLAEVRVGAALGCSVVAIVRHGATVQAPGPGEAIHEGDRLLLQGDLTQLDHLRGWKQLIVADLQPVVRALLSADMGIMEATVGPGCALVGQSLRQCNFRGRFRVNVIGVLREGRPEPAVLRDAPLHAGDTLLLQGLRPHLADLGKAAEFASVREIPADEARARYGLAGRVTAVRVLPGSTLAGKSVAEARLGDALGMTVLGIVPQGSTHGIAPDAREIREGDTLLVLGESKEWVVLHGLQQLRRVEGEPLSYDLVSERIGLTECVLSPRTTLAGKTLRGLHFREKYGLHVLAVWREGNVIRTNLRDLPLHLGDALLLYGPRDRLRVLAEEPDFIVLSQQAQEPPRRHKAPWAAGIMAAVILPVVSGWVPMHVAAVAGAALMVLAGCLTMDEAYKHIEWRSVFLIAGMLSLGAALRETGAARLVAEAGVAGIGRAGPIPVLATVFVVTALAAVFMPASAVTALLAPVVFDVAGSLHYDPRALLMTVAIAASTSVMSPVSQPPNLLVMGPGGYRYGDYLRVGLPLQALTLGVTLLLLPRFWPLLPGH